MATIPLTPDTTQALSSILYRDHMTELAVVLDELNLAPYNTPPAKLQKGYEAVLEERVTATEDPWTFRVASAQQAEDVYTVQRGACTCKYGQTHPDEAFGCHHAVAAKLYQRWQQNQRPFVAPTPGKDAPMSTSALEPLRMLQDASDEAPLHAPPLTIPRRSIAAIVSDLSKPLPLACLGTLEKLNKRTGKTATIHFVPWPTVAALLDTYAPGWSGTLTRLEKVGDKLAVTYRLTIPAAEGDFSQEDGGMEDEEKDDYGDALTSAIATAMKRAAAKFGVGRWLYQREQPAQGLAAHLKTERAAALSDLGKAVDEAGLARETTIAWLRRETGVESNAQIPLSAIKALTTHLSHG